MSDSVVTQSFDCSKSMLEVSQALIGIVVSIKEHQAKGLDAASIGAALSENISKIMIAMGDLGMIPQEMKSDPKAFSHACFVLASGVLDAFL